MKTSRRSWVSLAIAITCMVAWSPSIEAAVLGTATLVKEPPAFPFAAPEAGLGSPWVAYRLGLEATAGEMIGAVDVVINAPLHQRWSDGDEDGHFDPTPNANSAASLTQGDTHLVAPTNSSFGVGPSEDNSGTGSPLANTSTRKYGVGSYLRGAWALSTPTQSAAVAYVVIPRDRGPHVDISIMLFDPSGDYLGEVCEGGFGECSTPRVRVTGNGHTIDDGDVVPSELDLTDFGTAPLGSLQQRTFTITNRFDGLEFGLPTITGPFYLVGEFPRFGDAGGEATFTIGLDTAVPGNYTGSISFPISAIGNIPYNFNLAASVVPEPAAIAMCGIAFAALGSVWRQR